MVCGIAFLSVDTICQLKNSVPILENSEINPNAGTVFLRQFIQP